MKIRYNAPVSLTFSLLAFAAVILGILTHDASTRLLFSVGGTMHAADPLAWIRLFGHVLGHSGWDHLLGNLAFILLLGPILEEKYGSPAILLMIVLTALITSILNIILFQTGLLGASGIVFMFILLSSFTNISENEIPLTFLAIVAIYLSREIIAALQDQNSGISHFAHLIGGGLGSIFGFFSIRARKASA